MKLLAKVFLERLVLLGPCPSQGQGLLHWIQLLGSFTLLELVSLVKVLFRMFRLEHGFFWCSECDGSFTLLELVSLVKVLF
jgi:hypothetical protein